MDSNEDKKKEETPCPNASDDLKKSDSDDYNPYRDDNEETNDKNNEHNNEQDSHENIFKIDPEKGNISEQLGLDLDYPTQTKIVRHIEENSQNYNNAKNMELNHGVPQTMDEFNPYKNENIAGNDNLRNKNNEPRNFLDNFKNAINENNRNFNNNNNQNFNNNNNQFNNNYGNNNYNNNYGNNNFNNNNYNNNFNNNNFNNNYGNNNYGNNNFGNNNFGNNNFGNNNFVNNNYGNNNYGNNNYNNQNNFTPTPNNNFNNNKNNSNNNENIKKIESLINACKAKYKNALELFQKNQIAESKKNLNHVITTLDSVVQNINEKNQNASYLLPNISSLKAEVSRKLNEYNFRTYQLNLDLFQNERYQQKMELAAYAKRFMLSCPFISFNDIYDPPLDQSKTIKKSVIEIYERSQKSGYKCILFYGPKGSGKTMTAHALAQHIGGVFFQLEGAQNLKIQFFVKEFGRVCAEIKRPVVILVRNIETYMNNALPELLFLYDKFNTIKNNLVLIISSTYPPQSLPRQLKFTYIQCINCANQRNKFGLFKFLTDKLGVKVSMEQQDLMNFVYQNFRTYSNNDIFQVIKAALNIAKQDGGSIDEIDRNILEKALRTVPGSLIPQVMQYYKL